MVGATLSTRMGNTDVRSRVPSVASDLTRKVPPGVFAGR